MQIKTSAHSFSCHGEKYPVKESYKGGGKNGTEKFKDRS